MSSPPLLSPLPKLILISRISLRLRRLARARIGVRIRARIGVKAKRSK
jgi:hypothetical protein